MAHIQLRALPHSGGVEAAAPHRAARRAGAPHGGVPCAATAAGARRRGGVTPGGIRGDGRRHGEVHWGEALEGHRQGSVIPFLGCYCLEEWVMRLFKTCMVPFYL